LGLVDQVFSVAMALVTSAGAPTAAGPSGGAAPGAPGGAAAAAAADVSELDDDLTPGTARAEAGWGLLKALALAAAHAAAVQPHIDNILTTMRALFVTPKQVRRRPPTDACVRWQRTC
jgi:hypothetical protein